MDKTRKVEAHANAKHGPSKHERRKHRGEGDVSNPDPTPTPDPNVKREDPGSSS